MSFNLVDLIKDQVNGQVLGQISNAVGETPEATKSVIESAIPAVLGGLMSKASSEEGATSLFDAVSKQDDSILDNFSGLIGSANKDSLVESGKHMVGSLLGGETATGLVGAISSTTSVNESSANSIVGMIAPMAMSTMKRFMAGGGEMSQAGLSSMLISQKDNISAALPKGLSDSFNASGLLGGIGGLVGGAGAVAGLAGAASGSVGDLAGSAKDAVTGAVDGVTGAVGDIAGSATDAVTGAVDGVTGAVGDIAGSATDAVTGAVDGVTGAVGDIAGSATDAVTGAVDGATGAVSDVASSTSGAVAGAAGAAAAVGGVAAASGSSWIKKLIPIAILAVLAFFGYKYFAGAAMDKVTSTVKETATGAMSTATEATSGAVETMKEKAAIAVEATTGAVASVKETATGAMEATTATTEGSTDPLAAMKEKAAGAMEASTDKVASAKESLTGAAGALTGMVSGGGDVAGQLKGMFDTAQTSLGGITDAKSAEAALPALTDFSGKLDGITSMADKLPEAAKPIFNSVLQGGLGQMQPMLDKVMAIPGVGSVLGGVIEPLKEKLAGLSGE